MFYEGKSPWESSQTFPASCWVLQTCARDEARVWLPRGYGGSAGGRGWGLLGSESRCGSVLEDETGRLLCHQALRRVPRPCHGVPCWGCPEDAIYPFSLLLSPHFFSPFPFSAPTGLLPPHHTQTPDLSWTASCFRDLSDPVTVSDLAGRPPGLQPATLNSNLQLRCKHNGCGCGGSAGTQSKQTVPHGRAWKSNNLSFSWAWRPGAGVFSLLCNSSAHSELIPPECSCIGHCCPGPLSAAGLHARLGEKRRGKRCL